MRGHAPARIASLLALVGGAAACAEVLDLPENPRLIEAASGPATAATSQNESDDGGGGAGAQPASGEGDSVNPVINGTGATRPSLVPADPGDDVSDAGRPPAPADAGTTADGAAPLACRTNGRVGPNGNCFVFVPALLGWSEARQSCQALGENWDLAAIRSPELNAFAAGLISEEAWLGASDVLEEGTWLWVSDAAPFWNGDGETGASVDAAYANWNSDEPNGEDGSNCARIVPRGTWADLECEFTRASLCEGPAL